MPISPDAILAFLPAFLLVGTRIGGAILFLPIPGMKQAPTQLRAVLILAVTFALFPYWSNPGPSPSLAFLLLGLFKEAAVGVTIGMVVSLFSEVCMVGLSYVGLQAGYAYAITIDPSTDASVSVLESFGQLAAGLLFFALGLHREFLRAFALSLESHPPGTLTPGPGLIEPAIHLSSQMLVTGLRLALPVIAALALVDLSLALLGRLNSQLQLVLLAFPAKMLVGLLLIALTLAALPGLLQGFGASLVSFTRSFLL
jgi:flagellar biosynthesis protein FliR